MKRPEEQRRYLGFTAELNKKTKEPTDDTFRVIRRKWTNRLLDSFTVEDIEEARSHVREGGKRRQAAGSRTSPRASTRPSAPSFSYRTPPQR